MAYNQQYSSQQMNTQQALNNEQAVLTSNFVGNQMFVKQISNPLEILADSTQAYIVQEMNLIEVLGLCDVPNQYNVAVVTKSGQKLMLFKCIENSGCCQRTFCGSGQIAFNMDVNLYDTGTKFADLDKPFSCACCCCCRPEMTCKYTSNEKVFGKVTEPFTCCKPTYNVYDANEQLKYIVEFGCFNCACCDYEANIYKPDNQDQAIGTVIKKATAADFFFKTTTFEIVFPNDATPDDKMVLISDVLLIDYRMFEKKSAKT